MPMLLAHGGHCDYENGCIRNIEGEAEQKQNGVFCFKWRTQIRPHLRNSENVHGHRETIRDSAMRHDAKGQKTGTFGQMDHSHDDPGEL